MITQHPKGTGWIIVTDEVQRLLDATHQISGPDGQLYDPLWFNAIDFDNGDINGAREYALLYVRQKANEAEDNFDARITSSPTKAIFLNTEIVEYYAQGRPANPNPNIFVVSLAMATRRGISLHDMLEILFTKWRDIQASIAEIITELDRLIEAIEAAVTIEEIRLILEGVNFG